MSSIRLFRFISLNLLLPYNTPKPPLHEVWVEGGPQRELWMLGCIFDCFDLDLCCS